MNQASWNLCPQSGAGGCYWADDQAFDRLAGSISVAVPDVPDGAKPWCQRAARMRLNVRVVSCATQLLTISCTQPST